MNTNRSNNWYGIVALLTTVWMGLAGETQAQDKYIAQAELQVFQSALVLGMASDFTMSDLKTGKLYRGTGEPATVALQVRGEGGKVILVGVCDQDCRDIDLAVMDKNGRPLAIDIENDDNAMASFTAEPNSSYLVMVNIPDSACSASRCSYGVGAFGQNTAAKFAASSGSAPPVTNRRPPPASEETPHIPPPRGSGRMIPISTAAKPQVVERSQGSATCTFADGRHTVKFSDGGAYTGAFRGCSPQSGNGSYVTPTGETLTGYFRADGQGVSLQTNEYRVSLWLDQGQAI